MDAPKIDGFDLDAIDLNKVESAVLRRLIEEVRNDKAVEITGYNRTYNRYMGGPNDPYSRTYSRHNR